MRTSTVALVAFVACLAAPAAASAQDIVGPYFGPKPKTDPTSIQSALVAQIGAVQNTLDVANFTWSSQPIVDALVAAFQRGVHVRVVADSSETSSQPYTSQLSAAGVPLVQRAGSSSGIMHCKYLVFDGQYIWTGSANLTTGSSTNNRENGCFVVSTQLAADFENDFEQMFTQQHFSEAKTTPSPFPTVSVIGLAGAPVNVDVYFSGEDSPKEYDVLASLVQGAQSSVQILAYELKANTTGGTALLMKAITDACARGVTVQVVCDDDDSVQTNMNTGAVNAINAAGGSAVFYHPTNGLLHDKVFIVDGQLVEFGSFNYTEAAAFSFGDGNDEDFLVAHDPALASLYQLQFSDIWQAAGGPGAAVGGSATTPTSTTTPTPTTTGTTATTTSGTTTAGSTAAPSTAPAAKTSSGGGSGCEIAASGSRSPFALLPLLAVLGLVIRRRSSPR